MAIDHAVWVQAQENKRVKEARVRALASLAALSKQTEPFEAVIGDPTWEPYAAEVTRWIATAKEQANAAAAALISPSVVSPEKVWQLKLMAALAQAKAEAWQQALDYPKQLIHAVREAERAVTPEAPS